MREAKVNLCHYCRDLFPIGQNEHSTRHYYPHVAAFLLESNGCPLCGVIQRHFEFDRTFHLCASINDPLHVSPSLSLRLKEPHRSEDDVRWAILEIAVHTPDAQGGIDDVRSFSITTCERGSSKSRQTAWQSLNRSVQDRISLISTWVQDCDSKHGYNCTPAVGRMPKRLLEIGPAGKPPRLVLVDDDLWRSCRYATLSHCWGGELPVCLLKSNLHSYHCEIPLEIVPQTFHDAFAIVQALQIPYLWIDAFCITQDNPEEWEEEAKKMKDIYAGSSVNIAASDASKSQEGCFSDSAPVDAGEICLFDMDDTERNLRLRIRVQTGDTRQAVGSTILNTRGWVLQEQLLSHRMVSCMGSELHWECMTIYETEPGAQFQQGAMQIRGMPRLYKESSAISQQRVWRRWMNNYSKRKFTFWKDRLPALSGLIQHYENVTGDTPLFGLWKSSLVQDLLWIRQGKIFTNSLEGLRVLNLPSWSWLSCPAEIDFDVWQMTLRTNQEDPFVIVEDHCDLVESYVEWNGNPFTSSVKIARLILEGPTIEVVMGLTQDTHPYGPVHLEAIESITKSGQCAVSNRFTGQLDFEDSILPVSCIGLLLRSRRHGQTKRCREIFLILEKVAGASEHPTYKRLGIGCFIGKESDFARATKTQLILV